jgi:hypothetical protein
MEIISNKSIGITLARQNILFMFVARSCLARDTRHCNYMTELRKGHRAEFYCPPENKEEKRKKEKDLLYTDVLGY